MSDEILSARRKALEEQFFQKLDANLMKRLREQRSAEEARARLSEVSGIRDPAILEAIAAAGITAETLAALSLVPLVAVAWADGRLEARERSAVLRAAGQLGLQEGGPGYALLDQWLAARPGTGLFEAWRTYVGALSAPVRHALRGDLLDRARSIAVVSGGFLGLGNKVSDDEARVLAELERSLS